MVGTAFDGVASVVCLPVEPWRPPAAAFAVVTVPLLVRLLWDGVCDAASAQTPHDLKLSGRGGEFGREGGAFVEQLAKLRRYDAETPDQPAGLFQCYQADADSAVRRVCAGWAGCHEGEELLALRLAVLDGCIDAATYRTVVEYVSPVPLFP
ncbi:DUF6283 family protein [Streptomyces iranensis]